MLSYIILGIIQGLTEFLPVSSSAHLILAQRLLGITEEALAISVILHLGTLFALVIFFFRDIFELLVDKRTLFFVAVVTIITGAVAILGQDFFEKAFSSIKLVGLSLIITGAILILTNIFMQAKRSNLNFKDALLLGAVQGIAIIPGISRSGVTISTLLLRGVKRQAAFRISFLAAIPAICGAFILETKKIGYIFQAASGKLILGFIFSLLSGIFSLRLLKLVLERSRLHYFGYYCILVGVITVIFLR